MSDKNRMNKDQKKIKRWDNLIDKLSKSFNEGEIIDLEGVIYLIGIQELGKFDKKFIAVFLPKTEQKLLKFQLGSHQKFRFQTVRGYIKAYQDLF